MTVVELLYKSQSGKTFLLLKGVLVTKTNIFDNFHLRLRGNCCEN